MENITAKEKIMKILDKQPDTASYEEILKELVFEKMVDKGLQDSINNHTISNDEMGHRIKTW